MQLCIYLRLSKYPIQRTSTRNNLGAVHQRLQSQKLNRCPYRASRHGAATLLFRACLDDKNCSHCIVYYSSTLLSDRSDCGWCINVLMWVARFWCSERHAGLSATPTNTVLYRHVPHQHGVTPNCTVVQIDRMSLLHTPPQNLMTTAIVCGSAAPSLLGGFGVLPDRCAAGVVTPTRTVPVS
jgi:hypothetical protein